MSVFRAFCLHSGFRVPGPKAGSGTLRHVSRHSATVKSRSNNHGNRGAPRFSQEHPPQSKAGLSAVCAFLHTPRQKNAKLGGVIIQEYCCPVKLLTDKKNRADTSREVSALLTIFKFRLICRLICQNWPMSAIYRTAALCRNAGGGYVVPSSNYKMPPANGIVLSRTEVKITSSCS